MTLIACLSAACSPPLARAQAIGGTYLLVRDSDGTAPKKHATVTMTFHGGASGALSMQAIQPGETVSDTGKYSVQGANITIRFKEMEWEAVNRPFQFDGCTLTLPFKALGGSPGPGTSTWTKQVPQCAQAARTPAAASAPAGPFRAFSADVMITDGDERRQGKVFATDKAIRTEGAEEGRQYASIMRFDRKTLLTLRLQDRTYTESPADVQEGVAVLQLGPSEAGCSRLGEEALGTFHCIKEECRATAGATEPDVIRWAAKELGGTIVKYAAGRQSVELRNVRLGPQDPALFEVPAGFRKVGQ